MPKYNNWLYIVIIVYIALSTVNASLGDEQPIYTKCVDECVQLSCPTSLDYFLSLLKWTCPENCKYSCMQEITDEAIQKGTAVYQYYGKWPFYRFLGIQEPASVIFSIGNGVVHAYYLRLFIKYVLNGYFLKGFMILYTIIGMNAWFWSTIFHSRDTKFTELMDYFSAALLVLYTLFYAILRVFDIRNGFMIKTMGVVFICAFVAHVGYLVIVIFDYTYNMYANLIIGGLQISLWIYWFIIQITRSKNHSRLSYAYLAVVSCVGVAVSLCLELIDFPPLWRVFDAHSLWHFTTIPLTIIWYRFLMADMWYEMNTKSFSYTAVPLLPE
ncbi:Per1-like-domain-containing protein [Cokeromyces recurvatus]|uniref:Per1-like-domain-containing protein n=1 Tax=Cokeromyces recurvatus TaxID=90255 RepID=UPI00221FE39A|nr:Per1-like-domain-containing protein [Cokeromyces recurvatus]KAI7907644.1 Per1-like-domain-containing protein [Cokeromyces recurvatus]